MAININKAKQAYYEGNYSLLISLFDKEQIPSLPEDDVLLFSRAFCDMGNWELFDLCINRLIHSTNANIADKAQITKMRVDYTLGRSTISTGEIINRICDIEKQHLADNSFALFVQRNKYYINSLLITFGEKDTSTKFENTLLGRKVFEKYYKEDAYESIHFLKEVINDCIAPPSPNLYTAKAIIDDFMILSKRHNNMPSMISFYEVVLRFFLFTEHNHNTYEQIRSNSTIKLIFEYGIQCGHCCADAILDAVIGSFLLNIEDIYGLDILHKSVATLLEHGHYREAGRYYDQCKQWVKAKGLSHHPILDLKSDHFLSSDDFSIVADKKTLEIIYKGFSTANYQESMDLCNKYLSETNSTHSKIHIICFILNNNAKIKSFDSKYLASLAKYGKELLAGIDYSVLISELYTHMTLSHIGDESANWNSILSQLDIIGDNDYTASKLELYLETRIEKCISEKKSIFEHIENVNMFRRLFEIITSDTYVKNRFSHLAKWFELQGVGYFQTNQELSLQHFNEAKKLNLRAHSHIQYGIIQHKIASLEIQAARITHNVEIYKNALTTLEPAISFLKEKQLLDFVWRLQFLRFVANMEMELCSNSELSQQTETFLLETHSTYQSIYNKIDPSRALEAQRASIALGQDADSLYRQGFRFYTIRKDWANCVMWLEKFFARSLKNVISYDTKDPSSQIESLTFDRLINNVADLCGNTKTTFVYYYEWNNIIYVIGINPRTNTPWSETIKINTKNLINDIKTFRIEMMTYPITKAKTVFFAKYSFLIQPIINNTEPEELLCIIPYDFLCNVPFYAFTYNGQALIERNPIIYNASVSCWLNLHRQNHFNNPDGNAYFVGDPQNNLKGANKEIKLLAKLMQGQSIEGKDVSKQRFLSLLSDAHIFHYSGHCHITHFDNELAEINYSNYQLNLSDDIITLEDVIKTKNNVDLVVLSACATGVQRHYVGQELLGFPTAFLFSGSYSVISSMWPVDDDTTAIFFYNLYKKIKEGKNKIQALRETMIEEMKSHNYPYYWGAFIIWGL